MARIAAVCSVKDDKKVTEYSCETSRQNSELLLNIGATRYNMRPISAYSFSLFHYNDD
jgi:hypothetical protein